jgi:hypothetical protein
MAALGHSQAETVAFGHQHGCSKVESPLTLVVAPQFLTVPNDNDPVQKITATAHPPAPRLVDIVIIFILILLTVLFIKLFDVDFEILCEFISYALLTGILAA